MRSMFLFILLLFASFWIFFKISVSSHLLILLVCLICCLIFTVFLSSYYIFDSYIFIGVFFLFDVCMYICGIYLCVCTCACGRTRMCVNMKVSVDVRCPPQPLSSLFFATRSLTKPVARPAGL